MVIESPPNVEKERISKPPDYLRTEMRPGHDAWDLVQRIWLREPARIALPVDPFAISDRLGIKVWRADEMSPDISGVLRKEGDFKNPQIFLNEADPRERRRFTCAHALGHYTWNSEIGREGPWEIVEGHDFFGAELRDVEEVYATEFALEMLIPWAALVEISGGPPIASLAERFGVPADVMRFRLDQMGRRR
jgi:hypothetical protein